MTQLDDVGFVALSYIFTDRDAVCRELLGFAQEKGYSFCLTDRPKSLFDIVDLVRPGAAHKKVISLWCTCGGTVLMANSEDGWSSLATVLSIRCSTSAMTATFSLKDGNYPKFSFSFVRLGRTVRSVSRLLDQRWIFHQQGDSLDGEEMSHYKKRRIVDRISAKGIIELLKSQGCDLDQVNWQDAITLCEGKT